MKDLIREFEELSWLKKLLLAVIAPIAWHLYRLARCIEDKDTGKIIILALIVFFASMPFMVIDIVFIMMRREVFWFPKKGDETPKEPEAIEQSTEA